MAGRSPVTASEERKARLETLAVSKDRGEADRARAMRLAPKGWPSARIAEVYCAPGHGSLLAGRVRTRWRGSGEGEPVRRPAAGEDRGCAAGLACRCSKRPSPTGGTGRSRGSSPRSSGPSAFRSGRRSSPRPCEKNFRRRPRHTSCWKHASGVTKGRQAAAEAERVGLRLQLRKAQAEAGDISERLPLTIKVRLSERLPLTINVRLSERLPLTINVRSGCRSLAMRARR